MKDKFIKNLPYATTNCFILLLLYCSKYLNGITGGLYIVVCTLLFIIPNQMRPQSSQKTKKRWTITYIIIMLALTFMRYFKFISYISKKVSGEDVAWKYKYPLEKI